MTGCGRIALVLVATALALATAACHSMTRDSTAESVEFRARGNEPGWSINKIAAGITFRTMDGKIVTISPLPPKQKTSGGEVYRSTSGGQSFALSIRNEVCTDTMSGMPYPASVIVEVGAEKFSGCGGEPASLLHGEWVVEKINGKPLVDESRASVNFGADNQLSGNASCNQYFGSYALSAEGLTISELGSSMMMCDAPVMDQEMLLQSTLREINRFEIGPEGALILRGKDNHSIVASRKR